MKIATAAVLFAGCVPLTGGQVPPQTAHEFDCYVQFAEERMNARKAFLLADSDAALHEQIVHGQRIVTTPVNGANPHKVTGGLIFDWLASGFIPGVSIDKLVHMLQDYDHRAVYFPEVISTAKLLCRKGDDHFGFSMRLKEPAVIDADNDVVWQRVDANRWRCRSYSTNIQEIGKEHKYLLRLYSYWRFAAAEKGVYVEGQTITLSGEFGGFSRAIGSMMGINPEKSLKRSLTEMRDSAMKPGLQIAAPATGVPECAEAFRPAACTSAGGTQP